MLFQPKQSGLLLLNAYSVLHFGVFYAKESQSYFVLDCQGVVHELRHAIVDIQVLLVVTLFMTTSTKVAKIMIPTLPRTGP